MLLNVVFFCLRSLALRCVVYRGIKKHPWTSLVGFGGFFSNISNSHYIEPPPKGLMQNVSGRNH